MGATLPSLLIELIHSTSKATGGGDEPHPPETLRFPFGRRANSISIDELFGKYMFVAGIRPISSSIKNMSS